MMREKQHFLALMLFLLKHIPSEGKAHASLMGVLNNSVSYL